MFAYRYPHPYPSSTIAAQVSGRRAYPFACPLTACCWSPTTSEKLSLSTACWATGLIFTRMPYFTTAVTIFFEPVISFDFFFVPKTLNRIYGRSSHMKFFVFTTDLGSRESLQLSYANASLNQLAKRTTRRPHSRVLSLPIFP